MEYVGIDLHKKESQICLLTETGEVMEPRPDHQSREPPDALVARPDGRVDPALARSAHGHPAAVGDRHRRAPGEKDRRPRAGPPFGRPPLRDAARWNHVPRIPHESCRGAPSKRPLVRRTARRHD